jgi:hypothetical protein
VLLVAGCDYNDFILPTDELPQQDAGSVGNADGSSGSFVPPIFVVGNGLNGSGQFEGPNGNMNVVVDGGGLVPPNQFPTDSGVSPDEFVELDGPVSVDSIKPDSRYYFPPIWATDSGVVVSPDSGVPTSPDSSTPTSQDSGTTSQDADTHHHHCHHHHCHHHHDSGTVSSPDSDVVTTTDSGVIPSTCGNGIVGLGEDCDGNDLANRNCKSLGFSSGTLTCGMDCKYNLDTCSCYKDWKHEKVCKKYKNGKGHKKDCWKNKNCCKVNRGCGWGCK